MPVTVTFLHRLKTRWRGAPPPGTQPASLFQLLLAVEQRHRAWSPLCPHTNVCEPNELGARKVLELPSHDPRTRRLRPWEDSGRSRCSYSCEVTPRITEGLLGIQQKLLGSQSGGLLQKQVTFCPLKHTARMGVGWGRIRETAVLTNEC